MKHTKGPLEVRRRPIEGFKGGYVILNELEGETNAQIIAAAPEMLEALDELVKALNNCPEMNTNERFDIDVIEWMKTAIQVIKKAKGE